MLFCGILYGLSLTLLGISIWQHPLHFIGPIKSFQLQPGCPWDNHFIFRNSDPVLYPQRSSFPTTVKTNWVLTWKHTRKVKQPYLCRVAYSLQQNYIVESGLNTQEREMCNPVMNLEVGGGGVLHWHGICIPPTKKSMATLHQYRRDLRPKDWDLQGTVSVHMKQLQKLWFGNQPMVKGTVDHHGRTTLNSLPRILA